MGPSGLRFWGLAKQPLSAWLRARLAVQVGVQNCHRDGPGTGFKSGVHRNENRREKGVRIGVKIQIPLFGPVKSLAAPTGL